VVLASGKFPFAKRWNRLSLAFSGTLITAQIDGLVVSTVFSTAFSFGLAGLSSGWHTAGFDNLVVDTAPPPIFHEKNKLLAAVDRWKFDYNARTCTPHPQPVVRLRKDFAGKVGLAFIARKDMMVTALLRYKVDGNVDQHTIELFGMPQQSSRPSIVSIAKATVNMTVAPSDSLGFAAAFLTVPVKLVAGHTYYLMSSETAGGDEWMDQSHVQATPNSNAELLGSVYLPTGSASFQFGRNGAFAYGPVSLYFASSDNDAEIFL
jgi:hypothetical protein